jgi:NADH-quinone oxidoreductase subunit H
VPGWFGGVRVAAQAVTGSLPALVSLICVGVKAGGFRWSAIAGSQGFSPFSWTIFSDPFQCLAAVIFLISGLVLLSIPPMDAGLSMADLHGGVGSHLFGRRLVLFRLGRFYGFFLWAEIAVVLFLGAWALPSSLVDRLRESDTLWLLQLLELIWVLIKTYTLMLLVVWIARVNPRSRVDQVTDFAWKVLSPFSLFALIGTALWSAWRAL